MTSTIELRHLRVFLAVADELHFGRAAARLHMAQSPVSQLIRQLEQRLGAPVFARTSRRVELTAAGAALVGPATAALAAVDGAIDSARRAHRGEIGRLRVGFVDSAAYRLLPVVMRRFRRDRPDVAVELHEMTTVRQLAGLGRAIDVGIVRDPDPSPGVRLETLQRERLTAALPARHRLAGAEAVTLAELARDRFVMVPREEVPNVHDRVVALCRAAGFSPRVAQHALQHATALGLVEAGFGVTVLPESVRDSSRPGIAFPGLDDSGAVSELVLALPDGDVQPTVRAFRDLAHAALRRASAGAPTRRR